MSYNFSNAITIFKDTLTKQYWDVDGRTSRSDYWHFMSIFFIFYVVFVIVVGVVASIVPFLGSLVNLAILALLPPLIGLAIRRMHDVSKAWWFSLIPFYSLYLACMPGTPGDNEFGPNPLGAAAVAA